MPTGQGCIPLRRSEQGHEFAGANKGVQAMDYKKLHTARSMSCLGAQDHRPVEQLKHQGAHLAAMRSGMVWPSTADRNSWCTSLPMCSSLRRSVSTCSRVCSRHSCLSNPLGEAQCSQVNGGSNAGSSLMAQNTDQMSTDMVRSKWLFVVPTQANASLAKARRTLKYASSRIWLSRSAVSGGSATAMPHRPTAYPGFSGCVCQPGRLFCGHYNRRQCTYSPRRFPDILPL